MVMKRPPGSLPGIISFATAPAINPISASHRRANMDLSSWIVSVLWTHRSKATTAPEGGLGASCLAHTKRSLKDVNDDRSEKLSEETDPTKQRIGHVFTIPSRSHPQCRSSIADTATHSAIAPAAAPPGSCFRWPAAEPPAPSRPPTAPASCLQEEILALHCPISMDAHRCECRNPPIVALSTMRKPSPQCFAALEHFPASDSSPGFA